MEKHISKVHENSEVEEDQQENREIESRKKNVTERVKKRRGNKKLEGVVLLHPEGGGE